MKTIKKLSGQSLLTMLTALLVLSSCIKDRVTDINPVDKTDELMIKINVPGNSMPKTRAIVETSADDNRVNEVDILLFDAADKFVRSLYCANIQDTGEATVKIAKARIESGEYRLVVLANVHDILNQYPIPVGALRTDANTFKDLKFAMNYGDKWKSIPLVDGTSNVTPGYRDFPMWGESAGKVTILPQNTGNKVDITLSRMLSKINVSLAYTETTGVKDFVLKSIEVFNYNAQGRIVPIDANWIANPKKVTELKTREVSANPTSIKYDNTGSHKFIIDEKISNSTDLRFTCTDEIFVFESAAVNPATWGWADNTCIVIGGEYKGKMGYYRLDFLVSNSNIDLLRNHKYNFEVEAIKNQGFPDAETALKNKPENLEYTVHLWDEFDLDNIEVDGKYYIYYSEREVKFTQFGTSVGDNVIKIRTNAPDFSLSNFLEDASGKVDAGWSETVPGKSWTNGHFTVTMELVNTVGDERNYTVTITAKTAALGDQMRVSTFIGKGVKASVNLKITQEPYIEFKLIGSPDPTIPITIDGGARNSTTGRFPINITSTHDYQIATSSAAMIPAIYDVPTGGTALTLTNIPKTVTTLYVGITAWASGEPRVATIEIKHLDVLSTAAALAYTIVQVQPHLTATIGGVSVADLPKAGGTVDITVTSNVTKWAVKEFKLGAADASTALLDRTFGSGSNTVKLTLGNNSSGASQVYTISFYNDKNLNGTYDAGEMTTQTLTITHKSKAYSGVKAEAGIIGITEDGELTLDGWKAEKPAYLVYFKWGSLIGLSSDGTIGDFTIANADKIVLYTPTGFNTATYGDPSTWTTWDNINYLNGSSSTTGTSFADGTYLTSNAIDRTKNSEANGIGDPCALAGIISGGSAKPKDTYKMPANGTIWGSGSNSWTASWSKTGTWAANSDSYGTHTGEPDGTQKYPAAGRRYSNGVLYVGTAGYYWSSALSGNAFSYYLYFSSAKVASSDVNNRSYGYAVRCIEEKKKKVYSGLKAETGILGVTEDGELTLDGWKAEKPAYLVYFKWGSLIGLSSDTQYGAFSAATASDIINYVPAGFNTATYGNPATWNHWDKINYLNGVNGTTGKTFSDDTYLTNNAIDRTKNSEANGIGDPCALAGIISGGSAQPKDTYKMPTGSPYQASAGLPTIIGGTWQVKNGQNGHYYDKGAANEQFYPAAGDRISSGIESVGVNGFYWTNKSVHPTFPLAHLLAFTSTTVFPSTNSGRPYSHAVRCVQ